MHRDFSMNVIPFPNEKAARERAKARYEMELMDSAFEKIIAAFMELSEIEGDPLGRLVCAKLSVYIQLYCNRSVD